MPGRVAWQAAGSKLLLLLLLQQPGAVPAGLLLTPATPSADAIRAVCLPPLQQDLLQGTQCWVSGWGYTSPDQGELPSRPCCSALPGASSFVPTAPIQPFPWQLLPPGSSFSLPGQVAGTLKEALVPLIGTKRCNSSCMYRGELSARMLCAGHPQGRVDACQVGQGAGAACWGCTAGTEGAGGSQVPAMLQQVLGSVAKLPLATLAANCSSPAT